MEEDPAISVLVVKNGVLSIIEWRLNPIELDHVEAGVEGHEDDQQHNHEMLYIRHRLNDQINVLGKIVECAQPVEELEVHEDEAEASAEPHHVNFFVDLFPPQDQRDRVEDDAEAVDYV